MTQERHHNGTTDTCSATNPHAISLWVDPDSSLLRPEWDKHSWHGRKALIPHTAQWYGAEEIFSLSFTQIKGILHWRIKTILFQILIQLLKKKKNEPIKKIRLLFWEICTILLKIKQNKKKGRGVGHDTRKTEKKRIPRKRPHWLTGDTVTRYFCF